MSNCIDAAFATAAQEALGLYNTGQYKESHEKYKAIFAGISARYSQAEIGSNASIACILADFARVCSSQALYAEANSLFESAVKVLKDIAGDQHPVTLRTISEWIRMKWDGGLLNDSHKQSLWDVYQLQSGQPEDQAFTQHMLALLALAQAAYSDALAMLNGAKALCEASSSPTVRLHLLADVECSLGRVYTDLGQYTEAEGCFQRALKCMESSPFLAQDFSVAAPDHPLTARAYQGLGEVALKSGRLNDAVTQFNNALRVRTRFLGESHPETQLARSSVATAYAAAASFGMARSLISTLSTEAGHSEHAGQLSPVSAFSFIAASASPLPPGDVASDAAAAFAAASSVSSSHTHSATLLAAQILLNRATVSEAFAEYADATATIAGAREAIQPLGPRSVLCADILLRRARLELTLAQYSACRDTLQEASAMLLAIPQLSPSLCWSHIESARLACATSKFSECIASLTAAEDVFASLGGEARQPMLQIGLLASKTNLAIVLCDYPAALTLTEASMGLVRRLFGEHHPDFAVAVHERSRVLHAQAHFAEARKGHEAALKILEETLPPEHPLIASVSQSVGLVLSAGVGFAEAQERYCRVMQLRGTLFGPLHPSVADTLSSLASLERIQGHVEEALALLEQSLSIRRSAYGTENHIDVAASMTQLGELLSLACKYQESRESFVDALAIQRHVLGDRKHPDIARSLLGIVGVQFAMGDYGAALPLVEEASDIRLHVLGPAHPDYANVLQHRARVLFVQGRYADALSLHEQALGILEACLGPDHPDVASAAQHVGVSCQFVVALKPAERFGKADVMLQKALAIRRTRFGDSHPSVAETMGCLGSLRRSQGKLVEARQLMEQSLGLRRRTQRVHMDVARTLLSLGNLLCQMCKFGEAKLCYEEALTIAEQLIGTNDHPDIARILTGLAATKEAESDLHSAQSLLERALRIQQNTLGQQHRETSSTYHNLSLVLRNQGRLSEAQKLCEQALQQLEARLGDDHPDVARALNTLAELYRTERLYEKAAVLYAKSLDILERALGTKDVQFAEALNNLANVYSDWHKHNEAIPLYARAVEVQRTVLGMTHRNVAITLRNLGINHQELGNHIEALKAYQEAYTILNSTLGPKHADVKSLKRVIDYLRNEHRGEAMQEAISSAVSKFKSSVKKVVPKLNILKRKRPQKVKLLGVEEPAVEEDPEEFEEQQS